MGDVNAIGPWRNNAQLIVSCRELGYLADDLVTLDPTYGRGSFWKLWRPDILVNHDLANDGVDFRALPYDDQAFEAVVFDPPYKLNGTPTEAVDARFGVHVPATRAERYELIYAGLDECARTTSGMLLVKCQNQVNGGRVRWQTIEFSQHVVGRHAFDLVDMLHLVGARAQPAGRSQQHARQNYSTMLVLRRKPKSRRPA